MEKTHLFKHIKNLGEDNDYKNVRINNELTKAEREQEKELWRKAKEKREQSSSGEFTFKVRGPPWARKATKIRITPEY